MLDTKFAEIPEITRWQLVLLVLSLTRVRPFWVELGLRFRHPEQVRHLLKQYVDAERAESDAVEDRGIEPYRCLLLGLLSDLELQEGAEGVKLLAHLIEKIAAFEHDAWRTPWQIVLWKLGTSAAVPASMPPAKAQAVLGLARRWCQRSSDVDAQVAQAEGQPLADWDKEAYSYYRREDPAATPLDLLRDYLRSWRFDEIWTELLALLDDRDLQSLHHWGQAAAADQPTLVIPPPPGR